VGNSWGKLSFTKILSRNRGGGGDMIRVTGGGKRRSKVSVVVQQRLMGGKKVQELPIKGPRKERL